MRFINFTEAVRYFKGKTVAIVGSGPSVLDNKPGFIDSHHVVVRVNNYKLGVPQGKRCDVHYSFYGSSINKSSRDLKGDGTKLCMCKCPNGQPIQSAWHIAMKKQHGIDFSYIYSLRADWWFCETFIPDAERFVKKVRLLGGHIPSTGFSAILDVLDCEPNSVYLTGFDFFKSNIHNVDERWKPGDPRDPIGHVPELEEAWLSRNITGHVFLDNRLKTMIADRRARMESVA